MRVASAALLTCVLTLVAPASWAASPWTDGTGEQGLGDTGGWVLLPGYGFEVCVYAMLHDNGPPELRMWGCPQPKKSGQGPDGNPVVLSSEYQGQLPVDPNALSSWIVKEVTVGAESPEGTYCATWSPDNPFTPPTPRNGADCAGGDALQALLTEACNVNPYDIAPCGPTSGAWGLP